jgi:hypothetical protein
LNKNTFIPLKQLPFATFSEINISSKAEFSTQILLWREQQCHQNPDLGYTNMGLTEKEKSLNSWVSRGRGIFYDV